MKFNNRKDFFAQERLPIEGVSDRCAPLKIYSLKQTNHVVYEYEIDLGLNGEVIEIGQVSDIHYNCTNEQDKNDPEIMDTVKYRLWLKDGQSIESAQCALEAASLLDQIVVTGDTLDYLSNGAMEVMRRDIFDKYPNALCTLGGHELTKQMQTGKPNQLSHEERMGILRNFWIHDISYEARLVKDKVLCIGLDNSVSHYVEGQADRLLQDIKRARDNGYVILIFQHEPLATGKAEDSELNAIWVGDVTAAVYNFYDGNIHCGKRINDTDREMYKIITENADVIKGVFAGHLHNVYYTEIKASYTDKDGEHRADIPQVVISSNAYSPAGRLMRIIIK